MTAKDIKNAASLAKRTASALRGIAAAIRSAASMAAYNAWREKTPLREALAAREKRVAEMRASDRVAVAAARIADALEQRSTSKAA